MALLSDFNINFSFSFYPVKSYIQDADFSQKISKLQQLTFIEYAQKRIFLMLSKLYRKALNSNFQIPVSLKPNLVDLRYLKFEIWITINHTLNLPVSSTLCIIRFTKQLVHLAVLHVCFTICRLYIVDCRLSTVVSSVHRSGGSKG